LSISFSAGPRKRTTKSLFLSDRLRKATLPRHKAIRCNVLKIFKIVNYAECSLRQSLVPGELYLPATRSLSLYCLDSGARYASAVRAPNMGDKDGVGSDFWMT
jgi:hypothetical protein